MKILKINSGLEDMGKATYYRGQLLDSYNAPKVYGMRGLMDYVIR